MSLCPYSCVAPRARWAEEDREDTLSSEGTVTFNYLQQRELDLSERPLTPLEEIGTTDPNGITTG